MCHGLLSYMVVCVRLYVLLVGQNSSYRKKFSNLLSNRCEVQEHMEDMNPEWVIPPQMYQNAFFRYRKLFCHFYLGGICDLMEILPSLSSRTIHYSNFLIALIVEKQP